MIKQLSLLNKTIIFSKKETKSIKEYNDLVASLITIYWIEIWAKQKMLEIINLLQQTSKTFENDKKIMRIGHIRLFSKTIYSYTKI